MSDLLRDLREAADGRGGLALLSGEPGIGKSRLADQLAVQARIDGLRVLVGRCWDDAGAPAYWPWVQVIRTLLRATDQATLGRQLGTGASDVAQMVPELRELFPDLPAPIDTESESARFQLFDSATMFLRRASEATRMLIIIDDLHAADTPSILFLRFLASQLADAGIMVVGTYRDAELIADESLSQAMSEIARQPTTRSVALVGLGEASVRTLIEATAGVAPRSKLVAAIVRETGGNPLFLGEAVRLLAAEGRLQEVATGQELHLPIPPRIRDVITRRVGHLDSATGEALVHAAALGPEFSADVLRRVIGVPAGELLDRLGLAASAGLVAPVLGTLDRFRFTHDLIREALYDELAPGKRVSMHRRIADTLEALHGAAPEAYLAELAYHYFEACRGRESEADGTGPNATELAATYARDAGDQAIRSLAYEEGARLYRMGLAVLSMASSGDLAERTETLLRLGDAEARAGDLPSSQRTFLEAAQLARRSGVPGALARAALGYGGRFFWARVGHDTQLIPLLQDALLLLGTGDDRLRVRLLMRLACAWRSDPERLEQRRAISQQGVAIARGLEDAPTLGYALVGAFWAVWLPDNPMQRLELAQEMLAVAEAAKDAERTIDAHLMLFLVLMDLGRIADARARMDTIFSLAHELRQPGQLWLTWANKVVLALLDGDYAGAETTMLRETEPAHPTTPIQDDVSAARMHRWLLRREQGRGQEEEAGVRASVEEFPWYPLHRSALVCLLLDAGRRDEATAIFADLAADDFRLFYPDCEWLLGIALAAEACAALDNAGAAAVIYEQLRPFAGGHAVGHTEGSVGAVDRYLGLLAMTMGRRDDAVGHLESAVAANERMGAWPWAAHSQADLAAALRQRANPGDEKRAGALDQAALTTGSRLDMTALVSRLAGDGARAGPAATSDTVATFLREGEYWTVAYAEKPFRLRDAKGMGYLARLLAEPGRELHALDLATNGLGEKTSPHVEHGGSHADPFGDAGPLLDGQARDAYRSRLEELRGDFDEAESWADSERAARAQAEIEALTAQLAAAVGLGGRDRASGSSSERARIAVTRAIRASMARIAEQDPTLGAHLGATIRTGTFCVYTPDPRTSIAWHL